MSKSCRRARISLESEKEEAWEHLFVDRHDLGQSVESQLSLTSLDMLE